MKKLTISQEKLIDELKEQFIKLNEQCTSKPFNLINVDRLNIDLVQKERLKAELTSFNSAVLIEHNKKMMEVVNQLNDDFANGCLPLIAKPYYNYTDGSFTIIGTNEEKSESVRNCRIHVCIQNITKRIDYDSHSIGSKIIGFRYSDNSSFTETEHTVITTKVEDLLKHEKMHTRLLRLLEANKKYDSK